MRSSLFTIAALCVCVCLPAEAQAPAAADPARTLARDLSAAWGALAEGRAGEAERTADAILRRSPASHEGLAVKIQSRLASSDSNGALDAYEAWLQSRRPEDVFLLESIALGVLRAVAAGKDPQAQPRALDVLAAAGDDAARALLQGTGNSAGGASMIADGILAERGDAAAIARLERRVKTPTTRDVSDAIDALRKAKATSSAATVAAALDPARPLPTRMAAARALGDIGGPEAIPRLRQALKDPDPPVRVFAAASLARLGDHSGADIVRQMESSPVGDLRLLVAEANAPDNPNGAWVQVATGILNDPDPLVRLRAAEVLLRHAADPGPALKMLQGALADTNPAMRQAAAGVLQAVPPNLAGSDLPTLRKLLRDQVPLVRTEAAAAVLKVSGLLQ